MAGGFARSVLLVSVLAVLGCTKTEQTSKQSSDAASDARPNVILITLESIRADHVASYGYRHDTTPNLDKLAATGTLYRQAYSTTSWTLPSHASIFTGLDAGAHRVLTPEDRLGDSYTTIAEVLSANGYQTAGVVSGPYLRTPHNLNQGFEYYDDSVASGNDLQAHKDITNPAMERAIRKFLLENRDRRRPFFLFMYWWDPHYDYIPPPPYDEMFVPRGAEKITNVEFSPLTRLGTHISKPQLQYLQGEYDGEIRTTDEALGRLWALLRELDLWDNTTIIVTADHGEEFFEHGTLGHKNNLHVETLHVPLIMKQAGQREPREETRLTSLIDLFPTVLENTGLTSDAPVMGHSLLAPELPDRTIFHTLVARWTFVEQATGKSFDDTQVWSAARQGRYKFMVAKDRAWMLYDTQADPTEQHPLGPENVALIETFGNHLREWNLSMQEIASANESGGAAELSARDRDRLKSLGYIR